MTLIYADQHLGFNLLELVGEDFGETKTSALAHNLNGSMHHVKRERDTPKAARFDK